MSNSNISFSVNGNAVLCNLLNGEIRGRMGSKNDPAKKRLYRERRIIDSTPAIKNFMIKYPNVFGNRKLIHSNGSNFFEELLPLSSLSETSSYRGRIESRMRYEYGLTDSEISDMGQFLDEFQSLPRTPEIEGIVNDTEAYKKSIESAWRLKEDSIMQYIKGVLGYEPENVGKVNAYIMYPTFDTHRCCQVSGNKSCLFFAKSGESDVNKILASLTHQAVHQPMLPYKNSMTREEKIKYHAFIKFLTDKDVYSQLSGKSYLDIVTQDENAEVMGKIYPFWLGYRYRNCDKQGGNSVEQIKSAIKRDKTYFESLPKGSKKRKLYETYNFDKLDPQKIAILFRERRGITPYQFAKIDFTQKELVYQDRFIESEKALKG